MILSVLYRQEGQFQMCQLQQVWFTLKLPQHILIIDRLLLLHGPPGEVLYINSVYANLIFNNLFIGSGKTSLWLASQIGEHLGSYWHVGSSRALAQKVSIRLSCRYSRSRLVEVNAHTLCSKWFSESAKLVGRLFDAILLMLEDEGLFILVLIGKYCHGVYPWFTKSGDIRWGWESCICSAIHVWNRTFRFAEGMYIHSRTLILDWWHQLVNALLTALDKLRHRKNVRYLVSVLFYMDTDPVNLGCRPYYFEPSRQDGIWPLHWAFPFSCIYQSSTSGPCLSWSSRHYSTYRMSRGRNLLRNPPCIVEWVDTLSDY